MNGSAYRRLSGCSLLLGFLLCGAFSAEHFAHAQAPPAQQKQSKERPKKGEARPRPTTLPQSEPSAAYRESIRRTVEKRRQRRARRGQQIDQGAVGAIVPWPMPPALVIRHTPEVHSEIDALLSALRRSR
jgi:hypothetical protein